MTPPDVPLFEDLPEVDGIDLRRAAIPAPIADRLLSQFLEAVPWQQEHITMFGRRTPIPRLTAWYGDPDATYTYSGIPMSPLPWTPAIQEVREVAERLAGTTFNSVLLNLYRHGNDGVSWHADDEAELGAGPIIGSVSLGATRRFVLRRKEEHATKVEYVLGHGDVLVMAGSVQREWEHQVPKTSRRVNARVNLTFRAILADG